MAFITPTELARRCDITKQAAHKAVAEGIIPFTLQGKKKMIDLDDPAVQNYITDNTRQREAAKKNDTPPMQKNKIMAKVGDKKQGKPTKPAEHGDKKNGVFNQSDEGGHNNIDAFQATQRKKIADMRVAEAKANHYEKKLLSTEFIETFLFRYLERLNSNTERIASVSIQEIGNKILEAGEVKPAHVEMFTNQILEIIDTTKKNILKELKNYEPGM